MILGNTQAKTILEKYFATVQQGTMGAQFLLVSGPQGVGKTSVIEEYVMKQLGLFAAQDYLPLYDLGSVLGKKHTLKVEVSEKDQSVSGDDGTLYRDLGARQVNDWLSLAPAGDLKVVYLENIERMTTSAANALLKSLEEPLPGRLIIASTTNYKQLLDTIISRALIIRFEPLSYDAVCEYINTTQQGVAPTIRAFVSAYALGAPGRAITLLASEKDLGAMSESFESSVMYFSKGGSLVKQYQRLQQWQKEFGSVDQLLDALIYRLGTDHTLGTVVDHLIAGKKLLQTNVSVDTTLFWLCVDPYASQKT